jgi:hypothetical protein
MSVAYGLGSSLREKMLNSDLDFDREGDHMPSDSELRAAFSRALIEPAPDSLATEDDIPRKPVGDYAPSPAHWQDYVLYFLLPDRFADEKSRGQLDRNNVAAARPAGFTLADWAKSGAERWQGGTIKGLASRLSYLSRLGINATRTVLRRSPIRSPQRRPYSCSPSASLASTPERSRPLVVRRSINKVCALNGAALIGT